MFKRRRYRFPNAIEVEEYHSAKYGAPGQKRLPKKKPTPEQIEKQNQRNKEKRCRRKLRAHFDINDYFVTVTYERGQRPASMEEAKRDLRTMIRKLRKEYRSRDQPFRWIMNIECGTRGAWHAHIVINRIPDLDVILRKYWKKGKIVHQLLYDKGEFRELAEYITKTPQTDTRLKESSYSTSRNLPIPAPKETIVKSRSFGRVRIPENFYLDKDTYTEGINPVTGYPYRQYTLLRRRE